MSGSMVDPAALAGGGPGGPPGGPGAAPGAGADTGGGPDDNVICTVCRNDDGTFTVYDGDEPEDGGEDMSGDDAAAMGPGGDQQADQGQQASSVGEALKLVMQALQQSEQGGGAEADFASGFNGPRSATPATAQKY